MQTKEEANRYIRNYNKENYAAIRLYFTKKEKEAIQAYCNDLGMSLNEFMRSIVYKEMGDILYEVKKSEEKPIKDIDVYFTSDSDIIIVCEDRYQILHPNETGFRFGVKVIIFNAPVNLRKYFTEKKADSNSFERWNKIADETGTFCAEVPDIWTIVKNMNPDGSYMHIYSTDSKKEITLQWE